MIQLALRILDLVHFKANNFQEAQDVGQAIDQARAGCFSDARRDGSCVFETAGVNGDVDHAIEDHGHQHEPIAHLVGNQEPDQS
jgi:hypothetical protein